MKKIFPNVAVVAVVALTVAVLLTGRSKDKNQPTPLAASAIQNPAADLALVLTPPTGDTPIDLEIGDLQKKISSAANPTALLERLGWAYVNAARITNDPGFYKLAELCAAAIDQRVPQSADAALLRGHVYAALHRFKDAEEIARGLVARRQFAFDYALLGDALMEQGRLTEAVEVYQKMVDLKPCLQTYSRIAHMRWLKGDLAGALKIARVAAGSGNPREAEATAWAFTRLGMYLLQTGDLDAASKASESGLAFVPDFAPALLLRGRIFGAQAQTAEAVEALKLAAEKNPLPEYLWALSDALRADGRGADAEEVEVKIRATGRNNDPRTFSLFLSTHGADASLALDLARAELADRQDIFSRDALAWAQLQNGDLDGARENIALALSEGTQDARLFYHAAAIAAAANDNLGALAFARKAEAISQMLLPSERAALNRQVAALTGGASKISSR